MEIGISMQTTRNILGILICAGIVLGSCSQEDNNRSRLVPADGTSLEVVLIEHSGADYYVARFIQCKERPSERKAEVSIIEDVGGHQLRSPASGCRLKITSDCILGKGVLSSLCSLRQITYISQDDWQRKFESEETSGEFRPFSNRSTMIVSARCGGKQAFVIDRSGWYSWEPKANLQFLRGKHNEGFFSDPLGRIIRVYEWVNCVNIKAHERTRSRYEEEVRKLQMAFKKNEKASMALSELYGSGLNDMSKDDALAQIEAYENLGREVKGKLSPDEWEAYLKAFHDLKIALLSNS